MFEWFEPGVHLTSMQGTAFEKFIGKGQAKNLFFKVPSGRERLHDQTWVDWIRLDLLSWRYMEILTAPISRCGYMERLPWRDLLGKDGKTCVFFLNELWESLNVLLALIGSNHVKHLNFRGGGVLKNRLFLVCALVETVPGQPFWCWIKLANTINQYTHAFLLAKRQGEHIYKCHSSPPREHHCIKQSIKKTCKVQSMKHVYLQSDERPLWTQAVDNKSLSARLGIKQSAPLRFASDDPWHLIWIWNVEVDTCFNVLPWFHEIYILPSWSFSFAWTMPWTKWEKCFCLWQSQDIFDDVLQIPKGVVFPVHVFCFANFVFSSISALDINNL